MTLVIQKPTGASLAIQKPTGQKLLITPTQPVPVDLQGIGSVSLLLHGDGTNGSTTITDSSPTTKTVTAFGNAQISTTEKKFGTGSIYFDGTGDYVVAANNAGFTLPGDYTIELWIYPQAFGAGPGIFTFGSQVNGTNGVLMFHASSRLSLYANGVTFLTSSLNPLSTAGSWQHVAVVRQGTGAGNTVLYVNGTSVGSATNNVSFTGIANNGFCLGAQANNSGFTDATFTGYMDDIRVSRVARYTANFTPPTAPFPDI